MNHQQRTEVTTKFFQQCQQILDKKGRDYTLEGDVWKDLCDVSAEMEMTPEKALFFLMHKHYTAVRRFCLKGKTESEPIEGRLMDLANYASLIYAFQEAKKIKEAQQ